MRPSATIQLGADVNGDGRIGIEEVIYILGEISSASSGGVSEADKQIAIEKVGEAMPILETGDFTAARVKFEEALAADPENTTANAGLSISVMGENAPLRTNVMSGLFDSLKSNDLSSGFSIMTQMLSFMESLPFFSLSSQQQRVTAQSLDAVPQGAYDIDFDLGIPDAMKEIVLRVTNGVPLMDTSYFEAMTTVKTLINNYTSQLHFILPFIRKAEADPDLQLEIPSEVFKELFNYDLDGDGINDMDPPGDRICIDQGDFYMIDSLICMVIGVGDVFSAYSFEGASFDVAGDVNGDGYLDADEYMPPAPYYTLVSGGADKLAQAKTYLATAVDKLDTGLTVTLAETQDYYELFPVNSDPDFKDFLNSLKDSDTYVDLVDLKGLIAGEYTLDLSKGPFFLSGQSIRANVTAFFDNPQDLRDYLPEVKISDGSMAYRTDPTLGGNCPDGDLADIFNFAIGVSTLTGIPIIDSLSPAEATVGATVTISGEGFGETQGGIIVSNRPVLSTDILSWFDTEIQFRLASDILPGRLVVTVGDLRSNSRRLSISGMIVDNFDEVPSAEMAGDPPTTIDSGLFVYDIIDTVEPSGASMSDWKVAAGYMKEGSDIYRTGGSLDPNINLARGSNLVMQNASFSSVSLSVGFGVDENSITGTDNDGIGVIFRYQDENNFYRVMSVRDDYWDHGPWTRLEKWVDGELTVLAISTDPEDVYRSVADDDAATGDINQFRIEASGSQIKVYLKLYQNGTWGDEKLVFDVSDAQFSSGRIGVSTYSMWWAFIDYIAIQE